MADHFWARIDIGGNLDRRSLERFCRVFGADLRSLPECMENGHLVKVNPEASCGQFSDLEDLCRELGLSYIRHSDGRYECPPEITFWTPDSADPVRLLIDQDGALQVDMDAVRRILAVLQGGDTAEALRLVEAAVKDLPTLPAFRITEEA